VRLRGPDPGARTFDDVVAGDDFTCAFASGDASIHCWGRFADGGLGVAGAASHAMTNVVVPTGGSNHGPWVGITGGDRAVCGLTATGDPPACWGHLPGGATGVTQATPKPLGTARTARAVRVRRRLGMGTNAGMRVVWGANDVDQLGTQFTYATPNKLATDTDTMALAVAGKHGCKLTTAAGVVCFGSNTYGESGLPANKPGEHRPDGRTDTIASLSSCSGVSVAGESLVRAVRDRRVMLGLEQVEHARARLRHDRPAAAGRLARHRERVGRRDHRNRRLRARCGHALWCWGLGDRGELANGGRDLSLPTSIAIP